LSQVSRTLGDLAREIEGRASFQFGSGSNISATSFGFGIGSFLLGKEIKKVPINIVIHLDHGFYHLSFIYLIKLLTTYKLPIDINGSEHYKQRELFFFQFTSL